MTPKLYRGVWPQNVSRMAKYAVRHQAGGELQVTVWHDLGDDMRYFAVHGGGRDVAQKVSTVKRVASDGTAEAGPFYVNEFRHIIVPVKSGGTSEYYFAGYLNEDFVFEYDGQRLDTRAVDAGGASLRAGDSWVGPRPGIPYVLKAGGQDIQYESPALTEDDPPRVRPNVTRTVHLSKIIGKAGAQRAATPLLSIRGSSGGRFYVNEHGAMFTPVGRADGNGLDYVYCGQVNRELWFPEPPAA